MNALRFAPRLVVLALLSASASGCVIVRAGELAPATTWPLPAPPSGKTVSLALVSAAKLNGAPAEVAPERVGLERKLVWDEYMASGLFSSVVYETEPADVRAEVLVSEVEEFNYLLVYASGTTLTLIPAWADHRVTLQTTFKNAQGDVLARIEKSEATAVWIHLLLIFALPFNRPLEVEPGIFADLVRTTLSDARAAGVF